MNRLVEKDGRLVCPSCGGKRFSSRIIAPIKFEILDNKNVDNYVIEDKLMNAEFTYFHCEECGKEFRGAEDLLNV